MNEELDKKLCTDFPLLYRDRRANMKRTCMCWGFPGTGWHDLIRDLSSKLEPLIAKERETSQYCFCGCKKDEHENGTGKCSHVTVLPFMMRLSWPYHQNVCNKKSWRFYHAWLVNKTNRFLRFLSKFGINQKRRCDCTGFDPSHPVAVQVKEKFGCYDKETEVLTDSGWKYFKDVKITDKIATLKDGKYLEYNVPSDVISYYYEGEMYRLKTRGVDLLVTPNHNLYVSKGTYYNGRYSPPKKTTFDFELTTPDKYFGKNKRFLKSVTWIGEDKETFILPECRWENVFGFDKISHNISKDTKRVYVKEQKIIDMKSWVSFLGFYIAEGCSNPKRNDVSIVCCNVDGGKEKEMLEILIRKIGFDFKITSTDKSACVFRIYNKQLAVWLYENCGHLAQNKKVPEFIKSLSSELITTFLTYLYIGDGHKSKTSNILTTVSKQLCDDVQELLLKAGFSSYYSKRKPRDSKPLISGRIIQGIYDQYEINWLTDSNDHNTQNKGLSKKAIEKFEQYNDMVYCVTVPNNIIFIRRNGIPVWCGNSLRFYMSSESDEMSAFIREAEDRSAITCEECGEPGITRTDLSWHLTLCDKHYTPPKEENYDHIVPTVL